MFTGIVEKIGYIKNIKKNKINYKICVSEVDFYNDVKLGDSISVNGICLTVCKINLKELHFDVMPISYENTILKYNKIADRVNLERAMSLNSRFDGHIVTGHVDSVTSVLSIKKDKNGFNITSKIPYNFKDNIIEKGSICINGVSLTVQDIKNNNFMVSIIPETFERTNLKYLKKRDFINLEFDILMKRKDDKKEKSRISLNKLKEYGY